MGTVRKPVVAGSFYESGKESLRQQIQKCFLHTAGPGIVPEAVKHADERSRLCAVICPHAGYMYSGPIAAWSFSEVAKNGAADTVVLLGPNHKGTGSPVSVPQTTVWQTPLGSLTVNNDMVDALCKENFIARDDRAHAYEHSLEVQLPFLQYFFHDDFKIVPVTFLQQNLALARKTAELLYKLSCDFNFLIVASSDLTHYEPQNDTEKKDSIALSHILKLDAVGLEKAITAHNITMCGYCPVMTAMEYAKLNGAKNAQLLKYATSGDVSGDKSCVVGYAAVSFSTG